MKIKKKVIPILLGIIAAAFFLPVVVVIVSSLMSPDEVLYRVGLKTRELQSPTGLTLVPQSLSLLQYYRVLIESPGYLAMFWNSVFYSLAILVLTNVFAFTIAFALAKVRFRGRETMFFLFIIVMLTPFQVTMLSNYIMSHKLGLWGGPQALILPAAFAPIAVFLLRQTIRQVPDELIEAAHLETTSIFALLTKVIIPSVKPGLIAMNMLVFAESWNMVEKASLFLESFRDQPLSLTLNGIMNSIPDISYAGSVLYMLPVVILYFMFEDWVAEGLENFTW